MIDLNQVHQQVFPLLTKVASLLKDSQTGATLVSDKLEYNSNAQWLSDVDQKVDNYYRKFLTEHFPDFGLITEESDDTQVSEYVWVVDPIDGTGNYLHGLPYASLLCLWHRTTPIYGAILIPDEDLLIHGGKDLGVFVNNQPVQLSLNQAKPYVSLASALNPEKHGEVVTKIAKALESPRDHGSCGYQSALLVQGKVDILICYDAALWDVGPVVALGTALDLEIHWFDGQLTEEKMLTREYDQRVAIGRSDLIDKIKVAAL